MLDTVRQPYGGMPAFDVAVLGKTREEVGAPPPEAEGAKEQWTTPVEAAAQGGTVGRGEGRRSV